MESDSDTDDDFEECFGIAPYRFEPTNNSPEREISLKVDHRHSPVSDASSASVVPCCQCKWMWKLVADRYIVVSR